MTDALDFQLHRLYRRNMSTAVLQRSTAQEVSHAVITAAMKVHSELGRACLRVLTRRACSTSCSRRVFDRRLRLDCPLYIVAQSSNLATGSICLVEDLVIFEIKSVEAVSPVHQAQVISYLKLSGKSVGLLMNFNVVHLKDGIRRFVNGSGWREGQMFHHEGHESSRA